MDPEERKSWAEFDERMRIAEKRINATAKLVQAGVPMVVDARMRIGALMDSHTRLYGTMQQLAESQKQLTESQKQLTESHKQLAESHKKTEAELRDLAAVVKSFVASMKRGGNGKR